MQPAAKSRLPGRQSRVSITGVLILTLSVLVIATSLGRPERALAQVSLVQSSPGDGDILTSEPQAIVLTFSDRVLGRPASFFQVLYNGTQAVGQVAVELKSVNVASGYGQVDRDSGTNVTLNLQQGFGAGTYTVIWKAAAFDDGTVSSGSLSFTVAPPPPPAACGFGSFGISIGLSIPPASC